MRTNLSVPSHKVELQGSRHSEQHLPCLPSPAISDSLGPHKFPAQAARIPIYPNAELQSPDPKQLQQGIINKATKKLPTSQTFVTLNGGWVDRLGQSHIDGTEPKMFPGIVHERIQRSSTRQESYSEHDPSELGAGLSRLGLKEKEVKGGSGDNRPIDYDFNDSG